MPPTRFPLLLALGVDNFGSGLFLPITLVYVTRVVGVPVGLAGSAVTLGALAGLVMPPVAGRLVDATGARGVVVVSQLVQAAGMVTYVFAWDVPAVVLAAVLVGAGQQMFYASLFTLVADVSGDGPKDRSFAITAMVRGAAFGLGALASGLLLTDAGPVAFRVVLVANTLTFGVAAAVLMLFVRAPHVRAEPERPVLLRRDRPYLMFIVCAGMFALSEDFFLVGVPIYVLDQLHAPSWLPGVLLVVVYAMTSTLGTLGLRLTRGLSRVAAIMLGSVLLVVWGLLGLCAMWVSRGILVTYLVCTTLVFAAGELAFGPRSGALAEAAAPAGARGHYLAAFQYAFTVAQVLAPAVVAAFAVASWLPWAVVTGCTGLAAAGMGVVGPRLQERARS